MAWTGGGRGSTYAESTKQQIVKAVLSRPGRTGKQIAESLGLDRSRVNSFLYGEGRKRFGLVNSNWRWFPCNHEISWQYKRTAGRVNRTHETNEDLQPDSVCGILSTMSLTAATLKIRTMSLQIIELAFSEDEYPGLDDRLKAELIMRKKSLEAAGTEAQIVKQGPNRWTWVIVALLGAMLFLQIANQKPENNERIIHQGGGQESVTPAN